MSKRVPDEALKNPQAEQITSCYLWRSKIKAHHTGHYWVQNGPAAPQCTTCTTLTFWASSVKTWVSTESSFAVLRWVAKDMVRKKRTRSEYLESMGTRRTNKQHDWMKSWGQSTWEGLLTLLSGDQPLSCAVIKQPGKCSGTRQQWWLYNTVSALNVLVFLYILIHLHTHTCSQRFPPYSHKPSQNYVLNSQPLKSYLINKVVVF